MARKDPVSQYSNDTIGIQVYENSVYADPINNLVTVDITRDADQELVVDGGVATRAGVGEYSYEVSSATTAVLGDYSVKWKYQIDDNNVVKDRIFGYEFTVVPPQPYWDSLDPAQKAVVEGIYFKLSDGFDSTIGGPYLWELPQSSFGYETIARLTIVDGMNMINFTGPKAFNPPYTFTASGKKPIAEGWYGLVQKAGFYETLKHLSRSYLEIPLPVNIQTAHLDRTHYSQMWMRMATVEKEELISQIHMIKRAMAFGVKTRSKLLAGGIFPVSYLNPARPRWPYVLTRFY